MRPGDSGPFTPLARRAMCLEGNGKIEAPTFRVGEQDSTGRGGERSDRAVYRAARVATHCCDWLDLQVDLYPGLNDMQLQGKAFL